MISHDPSLPTGALPLHILDVSIARLVIDPREAPMSAPLVADHLNASTAFWSRFEKLRGADLISLARPQRPGWRRWEPFGVEWTIKIEWPHIIDEARVEALQEYHGLIGPTRDLPPNMEVEEQREQRCPQFFLRNVKRIEFDYSLPLMLFQIELWRDPDEYAKLFNSMDVLTYSADIQYVEVFSYATILEQRIAMRALTNDLVWKDQRGLWRENVTGYKFSEHHGPLYRKRVKGRFEKGGDTPKESRAETREIPEAILNLFRK